MEIVGTPQGTAAAYASGTWKGHLLVIPSKELVVPAALLRYQSLTKPLADCLCLLRDAVMILLSMMAMRTLEDYNPSTYQVRVAHSDTPMDPVNKIPSQGEMTLKEAFAVKMEWC